MPTLSEYQNTGFSVVTGLFSLARVGEIKQHAIRLLKEIDAFDIPSGVNVWMADQIDSTFREIVTDPDLVRVVRDLIGKSPEFLSVKTVFKSGNKRFPSPWHQDWFYWEGATKLSAWIALDDATEENGCLKMIPGSHTRVFPMIKTPGGGFERQIPKSALEDLPVQTVPVFAGDVVFFHDLAVHGSLENVSGEDRWSLIATYRDGTTPDTSTAWTSSLPL